MAPGNFISSLLTLGEKCLLKRQNKEALPVLRRRKVPSRRAGKREKIVTSAKNDTGVIWGKRQR